MIFQKFASGDTNGWGYDKPKEGSAHCQKGVILRHKICTLISEKGEGAFAHLVGKTAQRCYQAMAQKSTMAHNKTFLKIKPYPVHVLEQVFGYLKNLLVIRWFFNKGICTGFHDLRPIFLGTVTSKYQNLDV